MIFNGKSGFRRRLVWQVVDLYRAHKVFFKQEYSIHPIELLPVILKTYQKMHHNGGFLQRFPDPNPVVEGTFHGTY